MKGNEIPPLSNQIKEFHYSDGHSNNKSVSLWEIHNVKLNY